MTLREQVRDMFVGFDCDSWYCAGVIIELFEKMIDEKIKEQKTHEFHMQSKLDTYEELKEELKK